MNNVVKENILNPNYVFLGDSITDYYDLDKYYDGFPVVNSGIGGNTTEDILKDLKNRVYRYNPSKVILLIGTNDIQIKKTEEDIIKNIQEIVDNIKEKLPLCEIYVQSIYPVNSTKDSTAVGIRTNEKIISINKKIKELCNDEKITYVNMYDLLTDDDGNLNTEYTKEGLHISDKGYEFITKIIKENILK